MTEWFNSRSMCTWKQASGAARSHAPLLWGATVNYAKMKQSQRITCASFCKFCNVQYLRTACIPRGQDKSSAGALAAERRWPAHPSPRDRVHRCGAARSSTPRRTTPACTRAKAELDQNACPVQPYDSNRNITCQSTTRCFCATPPLMRGSACPAGHRP